MEGLARAIGVGLVVFGVILSIASWKVQDVPNGHQMRKLWPFSQIGSSNLQNKYYMTCVELWKASRKLLELDLWLFGLILLIAL